MWTNAAKLCAAPCGEMCAKPNGITVLRCGKFDQFHVGFTPFCPIQQRPKNWALRAGLLPREDPHSILHWENQLNADDPTTGNT